MRPKPPGGAHCVGALRALRSRKGHGHAHGVWTTACEPGMHRRLAGRRGNGPARRGARRPRPPRQSAFLRARMERPPLFGAPCSSGAPSVVLGLPSSGVHPLVLCRDSVEMHPLQYGSPAQRRGPHSSSPFILPIYPLHSPSPVPSPFTLRIHPP
eukprot:5318863-Prymnesium_polylepis.1